MVQALFPFTKQEERKKTQAMAELSASLASTRTEIQQAYQGFNSTAEGDLIESYVYEISALHARYNYLLRQMKELEGAV